MSEDQTKPGAAFQESSPRGLIRGTCVKCPPGKPIRDPVPTGFTGGWSHRHFMPSTYENLRLLERTQVFTVNHIVCTNSLGTVSHSYLGMVGTLPKFKVSDASQGSTLLADLLKVVALSLSCLTLFCTDCNSSLRHFTQKCKV